MADGNHITNKPWSRPDEGADALVLFSWIVVVFAAFVLLRPPALPAVEHPIVAAPAPMAVAEVAERQPDFYPWVRPGSRAEGDDRPRWTPPEKPRTGGFYTRLNSPLEDQIFKASNHGNTQSFYGGNWSPDRVRPRAGGALLEVRRTPEGEEPFSAGEMQSDGFYQYGRYEAVMQPAAGSGLVTAFFTYTGPWFGGPHDEIDIEFLGSDTTRIHFNYFRKGKSIRPATFDLPFDAAAAPRLYAFEWRPDGITWFVEDEPVYSTVPGDPDIPAAAGKVMFSAWTGKPHMAGWHGKPTFTDGAGAAFQCVSFTPMGHDTPKCSDSYIGPVVATLASGQR